MEITYILGNGFDLQCGLESRYSDFLKEYTNIQEDDSDNIKRFKEFLSKAPNQELWSSAEKALGEHLQYFSAFDMDDFTERIVDFESKMVDYLEMQQNRCSWSNREAIRKLFGGFLTKSFSDIISRRRNFFNFDISVDRLKFITFNYTNLLEKFIGIYQSEIIDHPHVNMLNNVYHVHGSLNSSIIMGVNDENQVRLKDGVRLTAPLKKQIIKPTLNKALSNIWDAPAMDAIKASNIIVIYGVSFGETDNIWWKAIREWLRNDDSHMIVAFVRTQVEVVNRRIAWKVLEYENEESPKILQKLGVQTADPDWSRLLNQIVTIPNTTRLNVRPILFG